MACDSWLVIRGLWIGELAEAGKKIVDCRLSNGWIASQNFKLPILTEGFLWCGWESRQEERKALSFWVSLGIFRVWHSHTVNTFHP